MRPIRLTIEGLRSFRSPAVPIDFTGRDHLAIVGDTGAGKSSILEAITYALYGQATFTAQGNQELMNDTSTHLRVVLRFRVSGEMWEVARTLKKDGKGTVGQPHAQLHRIDPDGAAIEQVEQVKPVNNRIKDLIGLDSDAFLRTVVLPQGRFARLLVEDKPTERGRILRQVWRTDELEAAGALAGAARQEAATLRVRLEQAVSAYPEDPAAHLARLEAAYGEASRHAATASEDERAASTAREAVLAADKARQAAAGVIERLRVLETNRAADRLAPIAAMDRQLGEEDAALKQRQAHVEAALARIPSDDGPTSGEVAAALTTLRSIGSLVTDSETAASALRAGVADASRKHVDAHRLGQDATRAQEKTTEHAAKRLPLDEAVESAQDRRTAVEQKYTRCEERATDLDETRKRFEALREEDAELAQRLEAAQEKERRAARAAAEADEHLADARRSESAAAAAHALHAGDECPICRRDLPVDWEAPVSTGLSEAQQIANAAHAAARQAVREVTTLGTERKGIERQIDDTTVRLVAADRKCTEAREELARQVELDAEASLPERSTLLAPLDAACAAASDRLAAHDRVYDELREESTRQDTAASVALEAASNADTLAEHARTAAEEAVKRLDEAIRAVPQPFRPSLDLPADPAGLHEVDTSSVSDRTKSAQEREKVLEERAAERQRLREDLDGAGAARSVLARRRADEIDEPVDGIVRDLNAHRDILVESVSRLTLDMNIPGAVSAREVGVLESRIGELRTMTADVSRAAGEHARAAAGGAAAARAELAAIGQRLDADIDVRDLDAIVNSARSKANYALFDERRARESAEDFAAIIDDVRRLRTLLEETEDKERALGDLEDALKPGAFLKWLTLRRSRRLLVHASRMLGEMSGGKYAFVDPGETEEQWRVLDRDSGQARSPASLSGGEQFIASLSLALGMVEMMARSGGRLESLFLDEGFGSLDRNNLDAAVQALGTVAASGRMVGVISHVRAVAEQIEHVLAVTRGVTGSQAEWLTSPQRQRLSESDAGWEATSALAGLLE